MLVHHIPSQRDYQTTNKNLRGSIKINSGNIGTAEDVKNQLKICSYHVFGNHKKCYSGCPKIVGFTVNNKTEDWLNIFELKWNSCVEVLSEASLLITLGFANILESYLYIYIVILSTYTINYQYILTVGTYIG